MNVIPYLSVFQAETGQLTQIVLFVVALLVAWFVLRFVFRLVRTAFRTGCLLILGLGLVLLILRYLG
jgi:hypothetical protein